MFIILFDCFRLLVVKQVEDDKPNEAEHLSIQITTYYGFKTELSYRAELKLFQQHIANFCHKLEKR
jgi:hypothetical protein